MRPKTPAIFAIVMFCFFVSGMAGLVYQVVWARYLSLFLGHTSYAVVAVLVAFMGGLALGNAWFGIRADRSSRPLALYGWLEIGIAAYAFIFPWYYQLCHGTFIAMARSWAPGSNGLLLLKFLFSFLTILIPTFLMGATLPVLTKFVTRSLAELREKVAALYCINSAGAVFGCLVADFWWIPAMGLEITVFAGAVMNLVVGAIAIRLSKKIDEGTVPASEPFRPSIEAKTEERFSNAELRIAVLAIGASGFVAMLYEVAWTRLLGLALGSSTHAFSLMLATFITGIAVGAFVVYRWRSLRRSFDAFGWAELGLAGALFISMFFYEFLPFWFSRLTIFLTRRPETYPIFQFLQALICFGVMFIPAVCLGMTLPLVSRIATEELARTGQSVGKVFAVNTIGTVLGAVLTGLWLMPVLGLARTFAVGIALNALIGLAIVGRKNSRTVWTLGPIVSLVFVWLAGPLFDTPWQRTLSLGIWRNPNPPASLDQFRKMVERENSIYYCDGAGATVAVMQYEVNGKKHLTLKVNGKADASTGLDMSTQLLSGHIPMLLRPDSQQVLVVGLGSGMTCSAVARHPTIQSVDLVEISPEVVEGARHFRDYNDNVLENPKVRVVIEDAKSFLKITEKTYDVIVSEPSNPWMAGVSGVFSLEYYEDCRSRLKPDGLMAQWVQVYETNDETLNMVLRTFTSVFPYTSIWRPAMGDLVMVGSTQPRSTDLRRMEERFMDPRVKADLERIEITSLSVVLSCELTSQMNSAFIAPPEGLIHSDFFPALEYLAQKAFFLGEAPRRWRRFDENLLARPSTLISEYAQSRKWTETDYKAFGRFFMEHKLPDSEVFRSIVLRWQNESPDSTLPIELMTQASDQVLAAELEALRLAPVAQFLFERAAEDAEPLRLYSSYLLQRHRAQRSAYYVPPSEELEKVLQRLIETNPDNRRVYYLELAELAWDHQNDSQFFEFAEKGLDPNIERAGRISFSIDPNAPQVVLHRLAESLWRAGKISDAWQLCQDAKDKQFTGKDGLLDLACRKIEAYHNAAGRTPAGTPDPGR